MKTIKLVFPFVFILIVSVKAQNIFIPTPAGGIYTGAKSGQILAQIAQIALNKSYQAIDKKIRTDRDIHHKVEAVQKTCSMRLEELFKADTIMYTQLLTVYQQLCERYLVDGQNKHNPAVVDEYTDQVNRLIILVDAFTQTRTKITALTSLYPKKADQLSNAYRALTANLIVLSPDYSSLDVQQNIIQNLTTLQQQYHFNG